MGLVQFLERFSLKLGHIFAKSENFKDKNSLCLSTIKIVGSNKHAE